MNNGGYGGGDGTNSGYLYCYINNGNIIQVDPYARGTTQGKNIGVIIPMYDSVVNELNDLRDTCMGYYNKLVEAKLIKVAKTPEEIAATQNEVLEKVLVSQERLLERIEKLEKKEVVSDNEYIENN